MAAKDRLTYFNVYARGEPTRILYALAGKEFEDKRIELEQWPAAKEEQPLGQLPVFECEKGTLVMSNTIARYVAKGFGLAGKDAWEEALNDQVMETCSDVFNEIPAKIYSWQVFKRVPEPEDSEKIKEEVKAKIVKSLNFIQKTAEKRGKKFIVDDKISLADVWLYCSLVFGKAAFSDMMEVTPWIKEFSQKMEDDEVLKKYLAERKPSALGI
ncbi:glutathione S-transferase 1-like [Watersipora subatra]|uniref:glutathione S-transferase 1-like n=1 Tax=Watersipora subatra TaxID=2589382 RepID=UPI00355BBB35